MDETRCPSCGSIIADCSCEYSGPAGFIVNIAALGIVLYALYLGLTMADPVDRALAWDNSPVAIRP